MFNKIRRVAVVGVAVVAVLAVGAGAAVAVLTGRSGTFSERQHFLRETTAWTTSAVAYVNVPGAAQSVTVPSGTSRLIDARFTAESQCGGTSGWCTVRIVIVTPAGSVVELNPASGTDFAFDAANTPSGNDQWESHAIERSSYFLGSGTYRVLVQAGRVGAATFLRLDDWHLAVEVVRP